MLKKSEWRRRIFYEVFRDDARRLLRQWRRQKQHLCHAVVTSPPYFRKRQYGVSDQEIGWEDGVTDYIRHLCDVFDAVPLHPQGSVWVNLGDKRSSQGGLLLIPEQFAVEMQRRGWLLINLVIWAKVFDEDNGSVEGGCMTEPAHDYGRLNGNGYEYFYHFARGKRPWADPCAVALPREHEVVEGEGEVLKAKRVERLRYLPESLMQAHTCIEGKCLHNVWRVRMGQTKRAHYAVYPPVLCERPIALSCPLYWNPSGGADDKGTLGSRQFAMEPYHEGLKARSFGRSAHAPSDPDQVAVKTGRLDSGRAYVSKKPVTLGWEPAPAPDWRPGVVLDPFCGSGTSGEVALKLGRSFLGIDLYKEYADMTIQRCKETLQCMQLDPWAWIVQAGRLPKD